MLHTTINFLGQMLEIYAFVFIFLGGEVKLYCLLTGDRALASVEKFFLLLKKMGHRKLESGLTSQFLMAMILEAFVKMIGVSFVLVIHFTCL